MADIREENNVFGGVQFGNENGNNQGQGFNENNQQGQNFYGNNSQDQTSNEYNSQGQTSNEDNKQAQFATGENLPVKQGFWSRFKALLFRDINWNKEIKVELTPYQQKVEDEVNEFLHQEITWEKVHDFLFQEISFGKKKAKV